MSRVRFVPNPRFFEELQAEKRYKAEMAAITVGVAEEIKTAAEPFRDTGNYIGRLGIRGGHPTQIEFERHFAHLQEYGSVNNPPQANARRGTIAAGLRFVDDGPKQAD